MREPIERMRKLINDNLVMNLRFQMNGELNKLESEIEQELNSRAERTCEIVEWYEARDRHEIGNSRVRFSCGHFGTCHYKFCAECGARVVKKDKK